MSRIALFSYRSLPHWERGTASAVDRVLSYIVDLRRISPLIFHTARTLSGSLRSPPSPRGEGFVRPYCFSTYACIRSGNARKAVFSFRSLPHWGRLRIHAKCDQNPRLLMRRASILNPSTYLRQSYFLHAEPSGKLDPYFFDAFLQSSTSCLPKSPCSCSNFSMTEAVASCHSFTSSAGTV